MDGIVVPTWLAQALAIGIGGQFVVLVRWLLKQDRARESFEKDAETKRVTAEKERALADQEIKASVAAINVKVDGLVAMLEKHNPIITATSIQAVDTRVTGLAERLDKLDLREASNHLSHHKLLRRTISRLDVAGIGVPHSDHGGDDDASPDGG
jgi:hypothetical protein